MKEVWDAILIFVAFTGGLLIVLNPIKRIFIWMNRRKWGDIQDDFEEDLKEGVISKNVIKVAWISTIFGFVALYMFILSPFVTILAIINGIGNRIAGLVVMAVLITFFIMSVINVGRFIIDINHPLFGLFPVYMGKEKIISIVSQGFFTIPTLYIIYIFLIKIGVI